uniref:DUF1107 domain-containing protein n=1 Tax=Thaumasiovibrio occultus TaxID=1891184 RepID=UPI000B351FD3|nr:DUF1107 domain-containing protein [Thaumasiovibrio occultus]
MRMFKSYSPKMVAKHITRLFKGRIYIHGRGRYDFDRGFLVIPEEPQQHHYQTINEVNQEIRRMRVLTD